MLAEADARGAMTISGMTMFLHQAAEAFRLWHGRPMPLDVVRPVLEKYFGAAASAEERLRVMHLISDLTARDFGGYHAVLAVHAEGSIEAEKLQIVRAYDRVPKPS